MRGQRRAADPEEAGNADLASSVPAGDQLPVQASAATEPPDPLAEDTQSDCGGDFATMTSGLEPIPYPVYQAALLSRVHSKAEQL